MRLIDHVRIEDPQFPAAISCIVADEIARQLDELPGDNSDVSFDAGSYGIVAPPFDSFFVEAETVVHHDAGTQMIQRGLLFEVWDTNPMKELKALYDARWVYVMTPYLYHDSLVLPDGRRWRPPMVESKRGAMLQLYGLTRTNGYIFIHLDEQGHILDDMTRVHTAPHDTSPVTLELLRSGVTYLPFALKALSALHQNTAVEHVTPSRQVRRRHQRKHGCELADYYLLKVRPVRGAQDIDQVGQPARSSRRRREHTVRGHFRYYSPEAPLFGRYSGMVWIPAHERGASSLGQIRKDYLVDTARSDGEKA